MVCCVVSGTGSPWEFKGVELKLERTLSDLVNQAWVRGNRQWRHLHFKSEDPRMPQRLHWRARFSDASKK